MNHVQSIIAKAVARQHLTGFSCVALIHSHPDALLDGWDMPEYKLPLVQEYCKFSGAKPTSAGFDGIHWPVYNEDDRKSEAALRADQQYRFKYRLEMLYYFWMANQEM